MASFWRRRAASAGAGPDDVGEPPVQGADPSVDPPLPPLSLPPSPPHLIVNPSSLPPPTPLVGRQPATEQSRTIDLPDEVSFGGLAPAPTPDAEIAELVREVIPGRLEELLTAFRLGNSTSWLGDGAGLLAAVLDVPATQLARWSRFEAELNSPPSYMWDDVLGQTPPDAAVVSVRLSFEARLLLASLGQPGVLYRRSHSDMIDRLGFTSAQCDAVVAELTVAGFGYCRPPTLRESVEMLTVAELEPLLNGLDIRKSWSKARKVDVLLEAVPEQRIRDHVLDGHPNAFDATMNITVHTAVDPQFHHAWARLAAHYLNMCACRDRDWASAQALVTSDGFEHIGVRALTTDDCRRCGLADRELPLGNKAAWPPFHLGCRCTTYTDL